MHVYIVRIVIWVKDILVPSLGLDRNLGENLGERGTKNVVEPPILITCLIVCISY